MIMNFLEERIAEDGIVKEGNILKVDSFLNHQMESLAIVDSMDAANGTIQFRKQ